METEYLTIDPRAPQPDIIDRAAEVLRAGGIVAFPTETVYGLAADALRSEAVEKIFAAKGRPATNPLIVHVNDSVAARSLTSEWPDTAEQLAQGFWPGPLSLVLPKQSRVPDAATAGLPSVALRVPKHPVARALIAAAGCPLAAPSANPSTRISATTAEHVRRMLAGRIDLILDGGPTPGGLESTVVDLTSRPPRLLRPGLIGREALEAVLGQPVASPATTTDETRPMPSPGMMARHYAPQVPLECVAGDGSPRVRELATQGVRVGWLAMASDSLAELPGVVRQTLPAEPLAYAAGLYAALHSLEEAGVERIVVARPPEGSDWRAVHDRLRRASAP